MYKIIPWKGASGIIYWSISKEFKFLFFRLIIPLDLLRSGNYSMFHTEEEAIDFIKILTKNI